MTWNELRNFHRQQAVVAFWRRLWGPALSWLTPIRRRLLLALGAVWIAAVKPFDEAKRIRTWFGFTPDTAGLLLVIVAHVAFVWMWYRVGTAVCLAAPLRPTSSPAVFARVILGLDDSVVEHGASRLHTNPRV